MGTPHGSTDLVIHDLAAREAELVERVAALEAQNTETENDNAWLKATLRESVTMLHRTNVKLDQQTRTIRQQNQTIRDLREQLQQDQAA